MKLQFLLSILSACCLLSELDSEEPSDFKVIGSNDPIKAAVGEDVILPCHLKPPRDVRKLLVKWERNGAAVHTYRSRGDDPNSQNESFKDRTSLFHGEMVRGNISLKLFNVTEQDKGVYTCFVPKLNRHVNNKGNVILEVVPKRRDLGRVNTKNNLSTAAIVLGVIGMGIVIVIVIFVKRKSKRIRTTQCFKRFVRTKTTSM